MSIHRDHLFLVERLRDFNLFYTDSHKLIYASRNVLNPRRVLHRGRTKVDVLNLSLYSLDNTRSGRQIVILNLKLVTGGVKLLKLM